MTTTRTLESKQSRNAVTTSNQPFGSLADMIRRARLARQLTQRQLSRALRKSDGYVGHLESGRFRPTVETLKALSSALGLQYGELAVAAGYISRDEFDSPFDGTQLARLNEIADLTDEEFESVLDFARYVKSRRTAES